MRARNSQSYAFTCSDGTLLCAHLSSQQQFWDGFVEAVGLYDLAGDPRCATRMARVENYDLIAHTAGEIIRRQPRPYWMARLEQHDVPFAPILDVTEVPDDVQVQHLGSFGNLVHPVRGNVRAVMRPVWLDGSRADQPMRAPPLLGEHTEEVLRELGLGPADAEKPRKVAAKKVAKPAKRRK